MAALSPGRDCQGVAGAAIALARQFDAMLLARAYCRPIHCICGDYSVPAALFQEDRRQIERHLKASEADFGAIVAKHDHAGDWQGESSTEPLSERLARESAAADIVVVAAAGNNTGAPLQRSYPAAYPGVIAVSAVDQSNQLAAFARADASIDLVAPGVDIFNIDTSAAGMGSADGTSTAAPQVSAAAALLRAHYPSASAATIRSALLQSATDLGPLGRDDAYGYGLLHIPRALAVLKRAQTQIPPH
jgi:subtilisin family serine protease